MRHPPSFPSIRAALTVALTACLAAAALPAAASSHREAPAITQYPKLDGTDLYVFRSYEPGRSDYVTIIANYVPLQDAYGGPNYFTLDPDGIYEIHIDNNGDAREDLTYQFKFQYDLKNIELQIGGQRVAIPLRNAGQIAAGDASARNDAETYTVSQINGARRQPAGVVGKLANAAGGASSPSPSTTSATSRFPTMPRTRTAISTTSRCPAARRRGGCSSASARRASASISARSSTS